MHAAEPEPEPDEGVRQRRARELRTRVHLAALDLAERYGMGAVTVAQISAAAEISRRSFFRHFGCKEEAVLSGHSRYLAAVATHPLTVTSLGDALAAIDALGDVVLVGEGEPDLAEHRRVALLIANDPAIRAYAVSQDRVIADMLRDRIGLQLPGENPAAIELVADIGVTIWRNGWIRWSSQAGTDATETPAQSHAAVRALFRDIAIAALPADAASAKGPRDG
ncbi:TetR/AcrR family transcriptional regulator [Leucobacter aridicollis]|uniref:TetR/AcrR family transcriptional regulator n=1 Tax=Leucobacter aridicollis TaxID=283878 RepID=UPI000E64FA00|nr:TetR/AcrR family transcriptional regulator [Leucobacter aridicollis]UTX54587.1 TetR family transcriptional regulator [Leucobacter aridicollis]